MRVRERACKRARVRARDGNIAYKERVGHSGQERERRRRANALVALAHELPGRPIPSAMPTALPQPARATYNHYYPSPGMICTPLSRFSIPLILL